MKFEPRKRMRLQNYNYSQDGSYFLTICVDGGHEILSHIIVGDAASGVPVKPDDTWDNQCNTNLTAIGEIVKYCIENINIIYGEKIKLNKYIIMPNHVHIVITLKNCTGLEKGTPKAASPTKAVIPKVINKLKGVVTRKLGYSIWQRSYYDIIIRNREEYQSILKYIELNPENWQNIYE